MLDVAYVILGMLDDNSNKGEENTFDGLEEHCCWHVLGIRLIWRLVWLSWIIVMQGKGKTLWQPRKDKDMMKWKEICREEGKDVAEIIVVH